LPYRGPKKRVALPGRVTQKKTAVGRSKGRKPSRVTRGVLHVYRRRAAPSQKKNPLPGRKNFSKLLCPPPPRYGTCYRTLSNNKMAAQKKKGEGRMYASGQQETGQNAHVIPTRRKKDCSGRGQRKQSTKEGSHSTRRTGRKKRSCRLLERRRVNHLFYRRRKRTSRKGKEDSVSRSKKGKYPAECQLPPVPERRHVD